ncbi:hypothetical protein CP10139811_0137 [Chlamydia ibidis]|uniref:Uncharacterized protein n=2 Tax=Chlamydia ibidis TaxID=1405396 RepID=S7J4F8_9CHLA|nr:hypothetical protein CP10139811_0137 [Chlamydia ibidis]EQM62729.1 hypothetical protein H359_0579 [Chlamydia ibidis 10-1398/6]
MKHILEIDSLPDISEKDSAKIVEANKKIKEKAKYLIPNS